MNSILIVDDNEDLARGVALILDELSKDIRVAFSGEEALFQLRERPADLVLSDIKMKKMDGLELLSTVKEGFPDTLVILLTGYGTIESAVLAIKEGAFDYLTKPFDNDELVKTVKRALGVVETQKELLRLRAEVEGKHCYHGMMGRDIRMLRLFQTIGRVAPSKATVLIRGESGTGKELVAKALHEASGRSGKFVAFNAAAIPETLAEAELFGAKKGAFTGAQADRKGHFQRAEGGTIFIDEISSMPLSLQGKLLRVLQEQELQPLGADRTVSIDVRVVAALNDDPLRLMEEGKFRQDLYYRLSVVTLTLPPLRDRPDDISLLATHFIKELSPNEQRTLSPEAQRLLVGHLWPGNVRELRNVIERALLIGAGDSLLAQDIVFEGETLEDRASREYFLPYEQAKQQVIEKFQRRYITGLLEAHGHNVSAAAESAQMTRAALYRIMNKLRETE